MQLLHNEGELAPALVICPPQSLLAWKRKLATWAPNLRAVIIAGSAKQRATAIDFYEILGLYKNAVILEGIYARFVAGQTHDARFADFGAKVEMYAEVALALTQQARL